MNIIDKFSSSEITHGLYKKLCLKKLPNLWFFLYFYLYMYFFSFCNR